MTQVASLYNDPSLLGPPVRIALVRLVVETTSTSPITSSANLALLHPSFCAYQVSASFPSADSNPLHHDFAVLLTRYACRLGVPVPILTSCYKLYCRQSFMLLFLLPE